MTPNPIESGSARRKWPRVLFSLLLLILTLAAYYVPYYDWDLVAYVGSAIALHDRDARSIQTQTYAALRSELPEDDYSDIASGTDFRRNVAANPDHFFQQLRFYQIRPLYIRLLDGMHTLGIRYVTATRVISAVSFALIGSISFLWAKKYVENRVAAICIPLLMISPVLFTSARTGSPDMLSAFLVLLGVFEILEHMRLTVGAALLLISLFVRTDNAVFVVLFFTALGAIRQARQRGIAVVCALLSVAIVFGINRVEHSYSWPVLMQNTDTPIVNPAEVSPNFSFRDYVAAMHDTVDEARESSVMVFPFIAAVALFSSRTPKALKQLVAIVLLSWAVHILLFPHVEDRYFLSGAAIIGVAVVCAATIPSFKN